MAARYEVGMDKHPFYWVLDNSTKGEDIPEYYNVTQESTGLECDGMDDACEEGTCQHIKAVKRFIAKQETTKPKA